MTENKRKRNFLKPLIIGALAVVVTGGVGAYAYDKYETAQRAKIQEAYSNVKMNVGQQSNQNNNNENNNNNSNNSDNGFKKFLFLLFPVIFRLPLFLYIFTINFFYKS